MRRKRTQESGLYYLGEILGVMSRDGVPDAEMFADFARDFVSPLPEGPLLLEFAAHRKLELHEVTALSAVSAAIQAALNDRNTAAVEQLLDVGLRMLVVWPSYIEQAEENRRRISERE